MTSKLVVHKNIESDLVKDLFTILDRIPYSTSEIWITAENGKIRVQVAFDFLIRLAKVVSMGSHLGFSAISLPIRCTQCYVDEHNREVSFLDRTTNQWYITSYDELTKMNNFYLALELDDMDVELENWTFRII